VSQQIQLTLHGLPIEYKPSRWITLDEQKRFCDYLEENNAFTDHIDDMRNCANEFFKYECLGDKTHPKKVCYVACGHRGECPRCSMSYAHKRAELMYQWLRKNLANQLKFDVKLNQIVLTLPSPLQEELDRKKFSKMIHAFMKMHKIQSYGYSVQFRRSHNPLGTRRLHAHCLTLNIKECNNKIVENEYYFDVDNMRKTWKEIIKKYTELDIESDVDLHTEYASIIHKKEKVLHILKYVYRYSIQDLFQSKIRNFVISKGRNSMAHDILQIEELKKDHKSLTWCGLLTSTKREYLIQLMENTLKEYVTWKSIAELLLELKNRVDSCRECGCSYSQYYCERGKYQGDNEPN